MPTAHLPTFDPDLVHRLRDRRALLTPAEMSRADHAAAHHGHPGPELMEAAGRAVARAIQRHIGRCRLLVLAGPGNNGGDGYIAARLLAQEGWPVRLAALAPPRAGSDAAGAAGRWLGPTVAFSPDEVRRSDVVVDAVFGAGLTRPLDNKVAETLKAAKRVVAVDVPSGLDGGTGRSLGYAPAAELTVTFFRLKPGHLLLPGRDLCGRIELADIGIPPDVLDESRSAHLRQSAGALAVASSDRRIPQIYPRACHGRRWRRDDRRLPGWPPKPRGGQGRAWSRSPPAVRPRHTGPANPACWSARRTSPRCCAMTGARSGYAVRGWGLMRRAGVLPALIAAKRAVVGDADVFSAFAGDPDALRGAAVLTPHAGEFARVFGAPDGDRLSAARAAAARTGAVVLLKGADTIIAAPDGRAAINLSAPPWLATAGAGDVLSGIIAGLLAQGMQAWEAACAGAYLHGRAAAIAGPGLVVEDLLPAIRRALATKN